MRLILIDLHTPWFHFVASWNGRHVSPMFVMHLRHSHGKTFRLRMFQQEETISEMIDKIIAADIVAQEEAAALRAKAEIEEFKAKQRAYLDEQASQEKEAAIVSEFEAARDEALFGAEELERQQPEADQMEAVAEVLTAGVGVVVLPKETVNPPLFSARSLEFHSKIVAEAQDAISEHQHRSEAKPKPRKAVKKNLAKKTDAKKSMKKGK